MHITAVVGVRTTTCPHELPGSAVGPRSAIIVTARIQGIWGIQSWTSGSQYSRAVQAEQSGSSFE